MSLTNVSKFVAGYATRKDISEEMKKLTCVVCSLKDSASSFRWLYLEKCEWARCFQALWVAAVHLSTMLAAVVVPRLLPFEVEVAFLTRHPVAVPIPLNTHHQVEGIHPLGTLVYRPPSETPGPMALPRKV